MEITEHDLLFDRTYEYFIDHIKDGNTLSKTVVQNVDFRNGVFFTFLPENANIDRLYEFQYGGIIPQNISQPSTQGVTPRNAFTQFIAKYLKKTGNPSVIFEDLLAEPQYKYLKDEPIPLAFKEKEVYYVLKPGASEELMYRGTGTAENFWHYLCVFTLHWEYSELLSEENFNTIYKNLQYIVTSAYDGESYIFWKKTM